MNSNEKYYMITEFGCGCGGGCRLFKPLNISRCFQIFPIFNTISKPLQ